MNLVLQIFVLPKQASQHSTYVGLRDGTNCLIWNLESGSQGSGQK